MSQSRRIVALAAAVAIAMPAEGLRRVVYYDPPGIPTVCWGHTGPDVDKRKTYSIDACKALLDKDMTRAMDAVERCAPGLPPPTLAALTDAVFNIGPRIVCETSSSTLARRIKAGDIAGACNELTRWDKATVAGKLVQLPGLTKRRAADRELCLQGVIQS